MTTMNDAAPGAHRRSGRRLVLAGAVALALLGTGAAWWWTQGPPTLLTEAGPEVPEVVPVTDGSDATGDAPASSPPGPDGGESEQVGSDGTPDAPDERIEEPPEEEEEVDASAPADPADEHEGEEEEEEEAGPTTAEVQRRLAELGYLVGPADGTAGPQTVAAVMAFQRVNELQVDGIVGPRTVGALDAPATPELRGGPATRIEVDLTRQLLHLVEDGERTATLHVSSGSGQPYTTSSGGTAYGSTPVGEFVIERRISGVRRADLGVLYDPMYFYRGWAIHGSGSVPASPASHGCVRITRADARWLFERVPDGTPVHLYGGEHVFVPSR